MAVLEVMSKEKSGSDALNDRSMSESLERKRRMSKWRG